MKGVKGCNCSASVKCNRAHEKRKKRSIRSRCTHTKALHVRQEQPFESREGFLSDSVYFQSSRPPARMISDNLEVEKQRENQSTKASHAKHPSSARVTIDQPLPGQVAQS